MPLVPCLAWGFGIAGPALLGLVLVIWCERRGWLPREPELVYLLMPQTPREKMWAVLIVSPTAAFCEEFLFRGFLQQQFARASGRVWVGVVVSAVLFGCAHGYEGIAGMLLITAYGAMFGVLALFRRGLRTGMIAHAWHDSVSGVALVLMRHYGVHIAGK